jgi:hypothetical protein
VTSVSVADTAANVVINLAALETLAAADTLTAISLTDSGTPTLTITATQLASDATVLGLIAGAYDLGVTGVTAANAATVGAEANVTSVSISDTAANVSTNLDALQALANAGELGSITLTDGGTPSLSITQAQLTSDAGALAAIGSSYHLSLSSVLAASAASVAAETNVTAVSVSDTDANVVSNLASLQTLAAASELTSITLVDPGTPVLTITATQLSSDATAIGLIAGTFDLAVTSVLAANSATVAGTSHVTSVAVLDTAANVGTNINTLETAAGDASLTIALTDGGTPTVTVTALQGASDITAIEKISSSYKLVVSDTAANVSADIDGLEAQATAIGTKLSSIMLTDSGTPTVTITAAQAAK